MSADYYKNRLRTDVLSTVGINQLPSRNKWNKQLSTTNNTDEDQLSHLFTASAIPKPICVCCAKTSVERSKPSCQQVQSSTNEQLTTESNFQSSHHRLVMLTASIRFKDLYKIFHILATMTSYATIQS